MDDQPHPFAKLSSRQQEVSAAFYDQQYEERQVDYLLKGLRFNATKMGAQIRRRNEEETGSTQLTFQSFNDEFESFPILLGSSRLNGVKLHVDPKSLLPAWFNSFSTTPFVRAYEAFTERASSRAGSRALGLVFPRKGIRNGLVIHNEGIDYRLFHGTAVVYVGGTRKEPHMLYVRPFQTLVESIYNNGHGWRP